MRQARTTASRAEESTDTVSTDTSSTDTSSTTGTRDRRGFGGLNKLNQTTFRVEDNTEIIVFLEPENFTYATRHWIKYVDEAGEQKTAAEWCLEEDCPLCNIGDRAKPVAFFNVVDLSNPNKVIVWEASSDPTSAVQKEYNKLAKKNQELSDDRFYWAVSREKKSNGFYTYSLDKVTEEDLATDWPKLHQINAAQRESLRHRAQGPEYVEYKTRQELQDFVDSLG